MNNSIKILGAYGAKTTSSAMTCIQVDTDILIDAGNILLGMKDNAKDINHIFVTHSHLDHIADIPFIIDVFFSFRTTTLNLYGTKDTLDNLKKHILNNEIWPDFTSIKLSSSDEMAITLNEINLNEEIQINDTILKAIKTNHTNGSCGYVIEKNNNAIFFTADTCNTKNIWDEVNSNLKINAVITDISFPIEFRELAIASKHYTLEILNEDIKYLKRDNVKIFINHLKPAFVPKIKNELKNIYPNLLNGGDILDDGDLINIKSLNVIKTLSTGEVYKQHIEQLIEIGHSLTSENNFDVLMEKILLGAKQLSSADGGTLYMLNNDEKSLSFKVVQTDSLKIKMGGTQQEINWPNVELYKEDGQQNEEQVAALCALNGELINIPDVYEAEGFNFEGTKKFDKGTGYRTKSMLVVPLTNHENDIIGVLQLLNKQDDNGSIIEFTSSDERLILSMGSQAAVSITNTRLIDNLEQLLMEFIKSTADAISEKSKYTGGHINRVAEISTLIANKINEDNSIYKNTYFNQDDMKQIDIAAWMHDIGKITTPEYIVDKATKLETIHDRISEIQAKFEIHKRDVEIQFLKDTIGADDKTKLQLKEKFEQNIIRINQDLKFIEIANQGSEYMEDSMSQRIKEIAKVKIELNNNKTFLLNDNEQFNLLIPKGTLTQEERTVINNHVIVSYNMLKNLSFPKKLSRVPIIAASHHKTIKTDENGKHGGYGAPEIMHISMSLEDKILAVADVFEAITASDRPYKKANTLNQSLTIMSKMVQANELDRDLVKFFIDNKIYEQYSQNNLLDEQLDNVTVQID
jgi:HD-GYP domain-containing protein (c-di-GMP phosphodiesterase class II)/phosphoribosyl 1,2-cyclic phosphodiesterase